MNFDEAVIRCNCAHLRKAARQLSRFYDACLAGSGLRTTQFTLLAHLARRGELTVGELAALLVADRATMGHNLRPLERDGLLNVKKIQADGRVRVVSITARGCEALLVAETGWRQAQHEFERKFGADDAVALRSMMNRIVATGLGEPD